MEHESDIISNFSYDFSPRYYIAQCRNQSWNLTNDQDLESDENVEEKRKNQDLTQGNSKKSKDANKLGGPYGLGIIHKHRNL